MAPLPAGHPDWLVPDWDAPGVQAWMTSRLGGFSQAPFDSMNLRAEVGDDPEAVARNQKALAEVVGVPPVYLNQVHGPTVVRLTASDAAAGAAMHAADGCVTADDRIACAVQVADCLPVLFAAPGGRGVGAAHAGWRGLAFGVLEATVRELCRVAACEPAQVQAWLGACIGPAHFEVGADVLAAFGQAPDAIDAECFAPGSPGRWWANLPRLARDRLNAAGVSRISGGHWCTAAEASRFFSYRRDRVTGRMAAVIRIDRSPVS